MKILTPQQIKQCDEFTINHLPVTSIELMERAASACAGYISNKLPKPEKVIIICGKGNNGGDGLAIARLLQNKNYSVEVFIIEHSERSTPDFEENLKRYQGQLIKVHSLKDFRILSSPGSLIIDAILGNGLNKPLEGMLKEVVEKLNSSRGYKLAIDVPTGLFANSENKKDQTIFKAEKTITFQTPKLNFLFKENYPFVGDFEILEIGWVKEADNDLETDYFFVTDNEIKSIYKKREKFVSKHNFGHALIVAGSHGKVGAAVLATRACLRGGAGLTTTYSPTCAYSVLQSAAPEAMCISDSNNDFIGSLPDLKKYNSVAIGSGIGIQDQTKRVVADLIQQCNVPLVIDADAINMLAENKTILTTLKPDTILTPHTKEFERLTTTSKTDFEKLSFGIEFAKKYQIILILKGVYTAIIKGDGKVYFNSTGNSSLAKGGSGDALTGIIAAQLAQGYKPFEAAILSVYLHGLAADICTETQGKESVIASDVIEALGSAFAGISE
jgi:ADP-dependent NAD(P)H-hydrate dehydratase / NAD(P)H-hydrate epimerase